MKTKTIFLIVLLFSFSLALAVVDVDVDRLPPDYSQGDVVDITLSCPAEDSTVEVFNAQSRQIYITAGNDVWTTTYNTNSDSSDGQYRLFASCADGTTDEHFFCVDAPGCTSQAGGGGSGGGTGRSCRSNITCSTFSYCNSTLGQARSCHDFGNCRADYKEVRTCAACENAWRCSDWTSCQGGTQTRSCVDDHLCGNLVGKPAEQQSCVIPSSTPPPRVTPPPPPPVVAKPSFFSQYKWWLLGGFLLLALIIAGIIYYYYHKKGHRKVYNLTELKKWISKERAAGTSDMDIKKILSQKTGWKKEEIEQAFKGLGQGSKPMKGGATVVASSFKPAVKRKPTPIRKSSFGKTASTGSKPAVKKRGPL